MFPTDFFCRKPFERHSGLLWGWSLDSPSKVCGADHSTVLPGELGADLLPQLQSLFIRLPGKYVLLF